MEHMTITPPLQNDAPHHVAIRHIRLPEGAPVGYQIAGLKRGPTLLVAGHGAGIAPAYRRILTLPNLSRIRGRLLLVQFDEGDSHSCAEILDQVAEEFAPIDDTLHLVCSAEDHTAVYWSILRFSAQYGMITGRGVPMHAAAPGNVVTVSGPTLSDL